MAPDKNDLDMLVSRLATRAELDGAACRAILALPTTTRTVEPSTYLIREGDQPRTCPFVLSGYAYRQKLTSDGARQIVAIMIAGDFVDLQNMFLDESDHSVQALTRMSVLEIPREALQAVMLDHPAVARALWINSMVDASIAREWIVNVGRRDARARVGHLLCEFAVRLQAAGIAPDGGYELPMTQEQLADAVGLTSVHVNRVLRGLTTDGLIRRNRRHISATDWPALQEAADFNRRYLHLPQTTP